MKISLKSNVLIMSTSIIAILTFCGCTNNIHDQKLVFAGFENVQIEGELKVRLNKNFDRLEEELYQPQNLFWSEKESGGWPADKEGRTILGLVLDARASHRSPKYLEQIISMIPAHLNKKGYMGTIHSELINEQQLSGHGWLLRGLNEYYEWTKDEKVLAISKTIVDSLFIPITPYVKDYPITEESRITGAGAMSGTIQNTTGKWAVSSDIGCIFIAMDGLIHAYKNNPNQASKSLIYKLIQLFLKVDLIKIKAQTHASLTGMRGLIRYAEITGDTTLIKEVEKRWALFKEYGMTENYENYNWFGRYDTWTEPCAIIDSYLVAVQLWKNTGNTKYLEDAEKIYWNGICMTQRANGGFGCDKCVGPSSNDISVHAYEAHWCCTMRGGEGLARTAEYSYFIRGDQILIPFYRKSSLELKYKDVSISQDTQYPFGNQITITMNKMPNKEITFLLFIPEYMKVKKLSLNGEAIDPLMVKSFLELKSKFNEGDQIVMEYALDNRWVAPHSLDLQNSTLKKAMFGPLVLGYQSDKPAIFKSGVVILRTRESEFMIEGTDFKLTPLYHLLDPQVSDKTKYKSKVLFNLSDF